MNTDWEQVRLEDITSVLGDGLHGTPKYDENGGYYFINGNNLCNGIIVLDENTKRASESEYLKYKKDLNDRTIFVSINGTIGNVAFYNGEKVFLGKSACYFNVIDDVDKQFIRYVLTSNLFQGYIRSYATGTTIKNVSLRSMRDFDIRLPTLSEQENISGVLTCIDEKIELNRKQNRTLEAIAQALFKRWFVEFEFPNENGQPYKSSGGAMQPAEMGEIPLGWEVKPLDQIADYLNGLALQKFPPEGDEYLPAIKIREMKQGITANSDKASIKLDPKYIVDDGDVLFSWSGSLVVDIWCHGKGALNQHLFKVTSDIYPKWFYYLWTRYHLRAFQAVAADKATTMGHIQRTHLTEALTVCPPSESIPEINEIFEPLIDKIISTRIESMALAKIRDTLLPKLMSGELRVGAR